MVLSRPARATTFGVRGVGADRGRLGLLQSTRDDLSCVTSRVILVLAGVPILLVYKQPDLGTALIMSVVLTVMIITSGARLRYLVILAVASAMFLAAAVHFKLIHAYQLGRLSSFLHQNTATERGQLQPCPVDPCHRGWRTVRHRHLPRSCNKWRFRPGPADRLHIHRGRRATGIRRRDPRNCAVRCDCFPPASGGSDRDETLLGGCCARARWRCWPSRCSKMLA